MQEHRQTIYTSHEERGGLRPHGGLSGAWRGDQVSIAKSRRRNSLRRLSVSINLSCHSEEHPKGTCFAARSDVGIRTLLVANSQKSVKIVRFWNRLPRQSADWLAMTGFFDSLASPFGRGGRAQRGRGGQTKKNRLWAVLQLVDKPSLCGQRFIYAGGVRGGKARLESDQMSRKALPCKACVEHPKGTCFAARSDYFCAARRHKNNDIISGCRKSQRLFRQPGASA